MDTQFTTEESSEETETVPEISEHSSTAEPEERNTIPITQQLVLLASILLLLLGGTFTPKIIDFFTIKSKISHILPKK